MVAGWKLRRELRRIGDQIAGVAIRPLELAIARVAAGGNTDKLPEIQLTATRDLALFVLFQPRGLSGTTFDTLEHLASKGFTTVVISNAKLSQADRSRLEGLAMHVLERRNAGYDFGGYQDAIRALPEMGRGLRSLLLLNDSVWFPSVPDARLLDEMRAHPADVVSAQIFGEGARADGKVPILASYMMLFKQEALSSDAFREFWTDYRQSSSKEITLRRGERGLSKALFASDLRCAGIYDQARLARGLERLGPVELRRSLAGLVLLDEASQKERDRLLTAAHSDDWAAATRNFLSGVAQRKNYIGAAPILGIEALGVEVVKKNNEMLYRLARQKLARWTSGTATMCPAVLAEIQARAGKDRIPPALSHANGLDAT